ncbi:MAG: tetratricopeptide repeat protein [Acidobacteria bacterium]|nr:tetratricopeptide repeat protein [Acidobacteriota bacterium]
MDLQARTTYRFENAEVDADRVLLTVGDEERYLRPKSFQVLVYLLENRDRPVSKDELIRNVWENTAVTDDVLVQCVKEIRRGLGDDSHNPRFIRTFPKLGYRFICPAEEFSIPPAAYRTEEITRVEFEYEEETPAATIEAAPVPVRRRGFSQPALYFAAAAAVLTAAVLMMVFFVRPGLRSSAEPALPELDGKTALAVMYFENRTGDPALDWMSEGIADMLITDLSRSRNLAVLSRDQLHLLLQRNELLEKNGGPSEKALAVLRRARAQRIVTGGFTRTGERIDLEVRILNAADGSVFAVERLAIDSPGALLGSISLLSARLAGRLGAPDSEKQANLADVMTDSIEAFRYYSLGIEKTNAYHNKEAIEMFEKAVALDPRFAMAYARIGYTYILGWGRSDEGRPYLEKAFRLADRLSYRDRLNITAWHAVANKEYARAIETYRQIIAEFPLETESYWRLGKLLAGEDQGREAIDVLRRGLLIDPNDKDLHNILGGLYSELGMHDDAIAVRRRYVELAPAEPNAYDSLGLAYQWSGDYESAAANYEHSLRLNPNFEVALFHLANTRFQTGRYNDALELLRRVIEIAPSNAEKARGWEYIAIVYLRRGELAAAEKASLKAAGIEKEWAASAIVLAALGGDFKKAETLTDDIFVKAMVNDRGARIKSRLEFYHRGVIASKKQQTEETLAAFREAVRRKPPIFHIDAFEDCLANALLEFGRYDEAIAEYQRIIALNPNYPLVRYNLARALQAKGARAEALDNYRQFLETWKNADPDIPEVIAARKNLE